MKKILQAKEKVLRQKAEEIPVGNIKTVKIKKVLKEMAEALGSQDDGVAIAAPQIGYGLRIFIVSGKIFKKDKNPIFINPKISKLSREKKWVPEGCLSIRPFYGKTFRSTKVRLTAYDENGKKFTRGASGLLAQILQHETDHLNGILFIDHAKDVKAELPVNKKNE